MKKSAIFLTLLLILSIVGTYAVYQLYVKDRMRELGEHSEQKKRLIARIGELEKTFLKTEPQVVLDEWRKSTQPWSEAVDGRARFFTLGSLVGKVEIPEEVLPKIYYKEEMPKRIKKLEDYAADKQVNVADKTCGSPAADSFGQGTNPKREEIAEILEDYDYCSAITVLLIDTKPLVLQPLRIWPEVAIEVKSGKIMKRTTGINMQIRTQSLAKFLDDLAQSDRYFRVEELKVTNSNLQQLDPALNVEMVLSQAYYVPSKKSAAAARGSDQVNQRLNSVFGTDPNRAVLFTEPEPTWWQQFRRRWIPF
jgi:hypothetical protein